MNRRTFLTVTGATAGSLVLVPSLRAQMGSQSLYTANSEGVLDLDLKASPQTLSLDGRSATLLS